MRNKTDFGAIRIRRYDKYPTHILKEVFLIQEHDDIVISTYGNQM